MAINLIKTANFGSAKTGLTTVGYRLLHADGALSGTRTTSGVGEIVAGSGIYSSSIYFSTTWSGSIVWDTGGGDPKYAAEEYSGIEDNVSFTRSMTAGRWKIDENTKEMIFYKEDNDTEIGKYNLLDRDGTASFESVFERALVSGSQD